MQLVLLFLVDIGGKLLYEVAGVHMSVCVSFRGFVCVVSAGKMRQEIIITTEQVINVHLKGTSNEHISPCPLITLRISICSQETEGR